MNRKSLLVDALVVMMLTTAGYADETAQPADTPVADTAAPDGDGEKEAKHPATKRLYSPDTKHDYQRIDVPMSWHAAKEYCEKLGGHLATATTESENKFIYDQFGRDHVVWLGATDEEEEGTWKWITGEPWEFQNWFRDEPNNKGGEHYLAIGNSRNITNASGSFYYRFGEAWNDHSDSGEYAGESICHPVCEWDEHDPDQAVEAPKIFDENQIVRDIQTLLARGKFDEAEAEFAEALKKAPDSARLMSMHLLASSYLSCANRTEDAQRHLESYLEYLMQSAAKSGRVSTLFGRYLGRVADMAASGGNAEDALDVINRFAGRAEELDGKTDGILAEIATQHALQLAKAGRADDARSIMEEQLAEAQAAFENSPEQVDSILHLATMKKHRLAVEDSLEDGNTEQARREFMGFLTTQAEAHPDSSALVQMYLSEFIGMANSLARSKPDQAIELLNQVESFLENEAADTRVPSSLGKSQITRVRRSAESARKMLELIGTPAVYPEDVDAWVNGDALMVDDMKGNVILLDFFAVWCGPCVATFPHLQRWQDDYADRGLHIIGVSRYYKYGWDEEASRPKRDPEIEPEQEREAMEKFLAHYELSHRIACVTDSQLQQHYYVSGIPHVVLIDRAGKVRMFRTGSSPQNAIEIEEAIEQCLDETGE